MPKRSARGFSTSTCRPASPARATLKRANRSPMPSKAPTSGGVSIPSPDAPVRGWCGTGGQYNQSVSYRTPLEARIAKKATKAIVDFKLIEDGDRVMVGLSGGKDSWALIQI